MPSLLRCLLLLVLAPLASLAAPPNLIWILADDLGYGDLGCSGQQVIQTPQLDRMAREGLRFTHFYAGATVCAPSRSGLMTGLHHGPTRVRGNAGRSDPAAQALKADDVTVPRVLQDAGYTTALIGKWGLGNEGAAESGFPRRQGFTSFFGYLSQQHAHNHFPDDLWRNESREQFRNVITPVGEDGAGSASGAPDAPVRLFDQQNDVAEKQDVAGEHPEIAARIGAYLSTARRDSPDWLPRWTPARKPWPAGA